MRKVDLLLDADAPRTIAALIDGGWTTATLLEKRRYPEAWRAHEYAYVVAYRGRVLTLESWEARERREDEQTSRISVRPPRPDR